MFVIEYEQYGVEKKTVSTDVKDVRDIILGITNNSRTADEAYEWVCNASFGDGFANQKYKFEIVCIYDETHTYMPEDSRNQQPDLFCNKKKLQVIADEITKQTGIKNAFAGKCNDSLTWNFNIGSSYMTNSAGKNLYFALNKSDGQEICTVSGVNHTDFINKVCTVIKRLNTHKSAGDLTGYLKKISASTGVAITYCSREHNTDIYELTIGKSFITHNIATNTYTLEMLHSDYNRMLPTYTTDDLMKFVKFVLNSIRDAKNKFPYEHVETLERIAGAISKQIGIDYRYGGEMLGSLMFMSDNSFICNVGSAKIRFSLTIPVVNKVINVYGDAHKTDKFIEDVVAEVKKVGLDTKKKVYLAPNKDVINKILWLESYNKTNTIEIYRDNCWWATVEVIGNRGLRYWVGYEDKRDGKTGGDLFVIYDFETQRYGCEVVPTKAVVNKIFSVHRALLKARAK